jgi:hypothetical protein
MGTMRAYQIPPAELPDDLDISDWGPGPRIGYVLRKTPDFFEPALSFEFRRMIPGDSAEEVVKNLFDSMIKAVKEANPLEMLVAVFVPGGALAVVGGHMIVGMVKDKLHQMGLVANCMRKIKNARKLHELTEAAAYLGMALAKVWVELWMIMMAEAIGVALEGAAHTIRGIKAARGLARGMEEAGEEATAQAAKETAQGAAGKKPAPKVEIELSTKPRTPVPDDELPPTLDRPPVEGEPPGKPRTRVPDDELPPTLDRPPTEDELRPPEPPEEAPPENVRPPQAPDKADLEIQDRYGKWISEEKKLNNATTNTKVEATDKFREGLAKKDPTKTPQQLRDTMGYCETEFGPDGRPTGRRTNHIDGGMDPDVIDAVKRHENAHYYSDQAWKSRFTSVDVGGKSVNLNEGVTELFSREAGDGAHTGAYPRETEMARLIQEKVGEDTLAKAYFQGDKAAMDAVEKAAQDLAKDPKALEKALKKAEVADHLTQLDT